MLGRTGNEVLGSARRHAPPFPLAQQPPAAPVPGSGRLSAPPQATGEPPLSGRRKAAVKKAFKRLDHLGRGTVLLEDALQTLAGSNAFGSMAQQELRTGLEHAATPGADGRSMLSFAAFCSYYQGVSPGYAHDGDFEHFIEAQWGCTDVSDILAALQRQFARIGLLHAFQDQSHGGVLSDVGPEEFKACMKRAGVQVRPDDMQRLLGAFAAPAGGMKLQDFKEQIVAPRPETPAQSRDLVLPPAAGAQPASLPALGNGASARLAQQPHLPPGGRPGTAPGHALLPEAAPVVAPAARPAHAATASAAAPAATAARPQQPPPSDEDLDSMLNKMESELHHLRKKTDNTGAAASSSGAGRKAHVAAQAPAGAAAAPGGGGGGAAQAMPEVDGPISEADMDAALSRMEAHLHHIKAHKVPKPDEQAAAAPPPVDMPHWEHHKYGHHEIKAPEWKAEDKITDVYGQQHNSADYHYNNYGAGPHGHHLAHYHLNDYGSLAHHSFQQQEYHRQQYGAAGHHGHWVPHLHGIGTQSHHGEHEYKKDEYQNQSYGKEGHHSHWVPHLHGLGEAQARPGAAA